MKKQTLQEQVSRIKGMMSVPKKFLEDLKDFDYWKEWKNNN